jgi:hypothetical protein
MKAARVLRFGSPNVITNDDLPQRNPSSGNGCQSGSAVQCKTSKQTLKEIRR